MSKAPQPEAAAGGDAAPAKKSNKMLFIIIGVLVLAGGGGGAYWWFGRSAEAASVEKVEEPKEPPAIAPLDPFVVNLADEGGQRFLRITIGLVVHGEHHAKEFEENAFAKMKVRSTLLEKLSQQTAEVLVTPEGKEELKKVVAETASHAAEHLEIADVLFSEFIVQ